MLPFIPIKTHYDSKNQQRDFETWQYRINIQNSEPLP
jgi:hypothetical protein